MSQSDTTPLTDEERAELEALRAEKARRERAELEELRAERTEASAPAHVSAPPATASQRRAPRVADEPPVVPASPEERTFGQRMVLSSDEDDDGIPTMPPAQKIVIGICLLCAVCLAVYVALSNAGVIG